ncbi:hypothetical protein Nlim_1069 [Candidatus Nitrosarchaeum limnium SFB1]|uniref:Uncharacterized protein n=1 Tax=Candidatus Nitrosarchaeum limnium SFB1 TaxID=886738 RepID=F3KKP5_9ARCH|nr:hypothetical protein Nlim_1069 [Candidatus Nitrosarchaeum limnium SFB1]
MRIYSLVHQPVFAFPESKADFPILFNGSLVSDQPVYLFDKPADWMNGDIKHLVAARPSKIDSNEFYTIISETLSRIQNQVSLEGAIACVGEDYLVYWELSANVTSSDDQASGISLLNEVLPNWKQNFIAESKSIPVGLWNNWNGINVHPGDCFNMKFHRREDI